MVTADAQQLRALVTSTIKPGGSSGSPSGVSALAVRAKPSWNGPDVLDGPTPIRVVACPSPLTVRAALADHGNGDAGATEVLAILTPCSESSLGLDVVARLAKRRVLSLDPYAAVLALFDGKLLDPTLVRDEGWLLDDLIDLAPAGGWPHERPTNGVVDADRAWRVWHAARFAGKERPESLARALEAGQHPTIAAEVAALDDERRASLARYWADGAEPVGVLIDVIAAGRGGDLTALALVVDALWATTDDPTLAQLQTLGRTRLEPVLGRDRVTAAAASAWAAASGECIDQSESPLAHLDRAQQLLEELDVAELAVLSDRLARGFDLRLKRLAAALVDGNVAAAEAALAWVRAHRQAAGRPDRVATAEAAVRLVRRASAGLPQGDGAGSGLEALTAQYVDDGAWVDEARRALTDGEIAGDLPMAYGQVLARVDEERRREDREFAAALADWSKSEPIVEADTSLMPLEHVLDQIVAPIAADAPVMVLVCDGMGLTVTHELLRDLAGIGWMPAAPADREAWPTGVALLPTVTEVSRASLLCGIPTDGGQAVERDGFAAHGALRNASPSTRAPVLFHKSDVTAAGGRALPDNVRATIADPAQRVVGVVVNAVDDHLSRGQQVRVDWGLGSLKPLPWLLDAAHEAGRVVVVTADHGHVIHDESAISRPPGQDVEMGERWRVGPPPHADDEVEVVGPRVLKGGKVILPADERVRYGGHKHGYHGGATAQEVLVPVVALARTLPEGWTHRPLVEPAWWSSEPAVTAQPSVAPMPGRPVRPSSSQPSLFEPEPGLEPVAEAPGTDDWVAALLKSETFQSHQSNVRLPRPLPEEKVAAYLRAIDANGGEIPLATLGTRVSEPVDQTRLTFTMLQRLMNLDGAEVLTLTATATATLNKDLATLQFDLDS